MQYPTRIGIAPWRADACGAFVALLLVLMTAVPREAQAVDAPAGDQALVHASDHEPDTREAQLHGRHGLPLHAVVESRPQGGGSVLEAKGFSFFAALPFEQPRPHASLFPSHTFSAGVPSRLLRHWLGVYLL